MALTLARIRPAVLDIKRDMATGREKQMFDRIIVL